MPISQKREHVTWVVVTYNHSIELTDEFKYVILFYYITILVK